MEKIFQEYNSSQKSQSLIFENKLKEEGMHFELANVYRAQGNFVNAVSELKFLLNDNPGFSYKLTLVDIYVENKSYEQALLYIDQLLLNRYYQKSVNKNIKNEKSWVGIGSIHCIKGDYELGRACFKRALDINNKNIAAKTLIHKFSRS